MCSLLFPSSSVCTMHICACDAKLCVVFRLNINFNFPTLAYSLSLTHTLLFREVSFQILTIDAH